VSQPPGRRRIAPLLLAGGAGLLLIALIADWVIDPPGNRGLSKVTVGTKDEVYYSHAATAADAASLGNALQSMGFFTGRGTAAILSKGTGGTVLSFVLNDGGWDRPATVAGFEEIGRRSAISVGGFPVQLRLCDAKWGVRKELTVGRFASGVNDEVYYFGSATRADAEGLAKALRAAGYLVDSGATVEISRDGATSLSFVIGEGLWNRPDAVAQLEVLTRKVAPSVGGLPVDIRLLNPKMEIKKEILRFQ
jgi:hypothetical protein